jgi:hypothetical protein
MDVAASKAGEVVVSKTPPGVIDAGANPRTPS